MRTLIWSFPILFILHDFEEIVGLKGWLDKNSDFLSGKFPAVKKLFADYSTVGMTVAVAEELIVCLIICGFAHWSGKYALWLGSFIVYALHLLIHLFQCAVIRRYIPAVITSLILLPISIYIIFKSVLLMEISGFEIALSAFAGVLIVGTNLVFAQRLIGIITRVIRKNAHIELK